jgi:class 3 adenylate cyclase/tetratricopeptide (TPR) repeat protein
MVSSAARESERRQATVLFADLSGFTAMSESMDAEEVTSVINDCFAMMGRLVTQYGGTIDKYMGDCIMALFGVPHAIEDAPCKAVGAALEMKRHLQLFNRERDLKVPLDVHIGINSGEVISGAVGSDVKKEFTVMGDAVNVASRLGDASETGQILVGPLTYKYTRDSFEYRPLRPIALKGKREPVPVFEVLSEKSKAKRGAQASSRMVQSEMVGRGEELAILEHRLGELAAGRGGIVNVIGEAGIGKSRLMAELRETDGARQVVVLEGRALSLGRNLGFHPLADMLKKWASIREDDTSQQAFTKLERAVRSVAADAAGEIFPFIATMMGHRLTGEYAQRVEGLEAEGLSTLIANSLKTLIGRLAAGKPVLFVLEDLHWADRSSLELMPSLYRLALQQPILFVNVFRPGSGEITDQLVAHLREELSNHLLEIRLRPLDEAQSAALTANLLKTEGLPARLREQIALRSEGNPFFIEEVVRSLIDAGAVETTENGFRLTESAATQVIPNSINELIMTRIDRLEEETRELLKTASVIGRSFFSKVLACMMPSAPDMGARMEELEELQLVRQRIRMSELEYLFKHALAQEAVYNTILLKRRKELHLDAARAIEEVFRERLHDFYGMLAYHYGLGEDPKKAEEYLLKAGDAALESSASAEALSYYGEAMKLYLRLSGGNADPGKLALLEKNIGLAYHSRGYSVEAAAHFSAALGHLGVKMPSGKAAISFALLFGLANLMRVLLLPFRAKKRIASQRDREIFEIMHRRCWALTNVDGAQMLAGALQLARRLLKYDFTEIKDGVRIFCEVGAALSLAGLLFWLVDRVFAFVARYENRMDDNSLHFYASSRWYHEFFSGNWQHEYHQELVEYLVNRAELEPLKNYIFLQAEERIQKGDFQAVDSITRESEKIADRFDNDVMKANSYQLLTRRAMKASRTDAALETVVKSIALTERLGITSVDAIARGYLADIHVMRREYEAAERTLREIHNQVQKRGESKFVPLQIVPYLMAQFNYDLAMFVNAVASGDRRAASSCRQRSRASGRKAIAQASRIASHRVEAFRQMGVWFWLSGKKRGALRWWARSLEEAKRLGARLELAKTCAAIGERLREQDGRGPNIPGGKGMTGPEYLAQAERLFKEMGLPERLEESGKTL